MRNDLKNAMEALNLKTPLRLNSNGPSFQAPMPLDERKAPASPIESPQAPIPLAVSEQGIQGESVSKNDPVRNKQGSHLTLSKADSVSAEPCEKRRGSKTDPVPEARETPQAARVTGAFTAVPHELLRGEGKFSDPLDFMIYMHLFTYSYGFGRPTASMSQGQLERFSKAARNTVRRSLERLVKDGWIKMVEEYEHARMSRKWRVYLPEERTKKKGFKTDLIQNRQGSKLTPSLANLDPVTGFKLNPYKESIHKEKSENSLSQSSADNMIRGSEELPGLLMRYFAELRPERKRQSEYDAFLGIRKDFTPEEVSQALIYLQQKGLPDGGQCHSPMAYLAYSIADILANVRQCQETERLSAGAAVRQVQLARVQEEAESRERAEAQMRERAFNQAFITAERQQEVISELCRRYGFLLSRGEAARAFAVAAWWGDLSVHERSKLT